MPGNVSAMLKLGLNARHPCHLGLPRPVEPYTVRRTTKTFSTNSRAVLFGTFQSVDEAGKEGPVWANLCAVGASNLANPINGTDNMHCFCCNVKMRQEAFHFLKFQSIFRTHLQLCKLIDLFKLRSPIVSFVRCFRLFYNNLHLPTFAPPIRIKAMHFIIQHACSRFCHLALDWLINLHGYPKYPTGNCTLCESAFLVGICMIFAVCFWRF